jgi:hypothetical protein
LARTFTYLSYRGDVPSVRRVTSRDESVSLRGHHLDQRLALAPLIQDLPQRGHLEREIRLLDDRIGPQSRRQGGLLDELSGPLHQIDGQVERLRRQLNSSPVTQQKPLARYG